MPRARLLKPGFFKNEELAVLPFEVRLCYAGLWTLADREGRLEDRPERIKVELFPYDTHIDSRSVHEICKSLSDRGFIVRYGTKGGADKSTRYIAIPTFLDHQTPHHREPPSRIPAPPSRLLKSRAKTRAKPEAENRAEPEAMPEAEPESSLSDPVTGDPVPESVPDPVREERAPTARVSGSNGVRTEQHECLDAAPRGRAFERAGSADVLAKLTPHERALLKKHGLA